MNFLFYERTLAQNIRLELKVPKAFICGMVSIFLIRTIYLYLFSQNYLMVKDEFYFRKLIIKKKIIST